MRLIVCPMAKQSIINMDLGESAVVEKEEMEEDAGGTDGAGKGYSSLTEVLLAFHSHLRLHLLVIPARMEHLSCVRFLAFQQILKSGHIVEHEPERQEPTHAVSGQVLIEHQEAVTEIQIGLPRALIGQGTSA